MGRGIGMVNRACLQAGAEDDAVSLYRSGGYGIGLGARRVERARPSEAETPIYHSDSCSRAKGRHRGNRPQSAKVAPVNIADLAVFLEIEFRGKQEVAVKWTAAAADTTLP